MKNDLQTLILSELITKKATDTMRGYHDNFDVTTNNRNGHTNIVAGSVGTQNFTTNNNNNRSSSSSSRKRKHRHQSDSVDDDDDEDEAEDDVNDDERRTSAEKLDYLVGGEQRFTIQEHDNAWIVNNTNISKNFHIFRNKCIDMLERGRVGINHTQELALNGIMWIDDKNRRYYDLNTEQWAVAVKEACQRYPRAEKVDFSEVAKIAEVLADDFAAGERLAEVWYCSVVNANDKDMKLIARTVLDLIQKSRSTKAVEMKEPLFCSFLVESIVTPFLCLDNECLTLLGNTDESIGSRMRRQQGGRRPDLSVIAEFNNQSATPFMCEVKSSQFI